LRYENTDEVSSRYIFRDRPATSTKPEDYLSGILTVREGEPGAYRAIRDLLDRPRDWERMPFRTAAETCRNPVPAFTVGSPDRAQVRYNKALVDIISMVKHAAREEEPLCRRQADPPGLWTQMAYTTSLTPEQQQWLDKIREHLIANLSISKSDFDSSDLFQRGGMGQSEPGLFRAAARPDPAVE